MSSSDQTKLQGCDLKRRLLILLVVTMALYFAGILLWIALKPVLIEQGVPETFRLLHGEVQPLRRADEPIPIRKGKVNGILIAVPSNYLKYAIEYEDKSIWEVPKPDDKNPNGRTLSDAVSAFTLLVRWPDLAPRNPETEQSFWNRDKPEGQSWLSIGVVSDYATNPRPPTTPDNGLARSVRGILKRLSANGLAKAQREIVDPADLRREHHIKSTYLRYALRGLDPTTGLQWAEPVGSGSEHFSIWNKTLYWKGDADSIVTDLISCQNGRLLNPTQHHKCDQKYILPEWGSYVSVTYPRVLLPQWREIKMRTRELLLGFQVDPESQNVTRQTSNKESKP